MCRCRPERGRSSVVVGMLAGAMVDRQCFDCGTLKQLA
jgi:hypothetical protein